jgi:amino acid transporter
LAAIVASSRILFALCRDLAPKSALGRVSKVSGTPRTAGVCIVVASMVGYSLMRVVFHASGSDAFFWASTIGALALLVAYLLVAASAAGTLLRSQHRRDQRLLVIPALGALAIGYTMWVNVYPPQAGAYALIPWLVLAWCVAPLFATMVNPGLVERVKSGFLTAHSSRA